MAVSFGDANLLCTRPCFTCCGWSLSILQYTMGFWTPLQRSLLLVVLVALALTGDGSRCSVQALTFTTSSASTARSHSFGLSGVNKEGGAGAVNSCKRSTSRSNSRSLLTTLSAASSREEDLEKTRQIICQHTSEEKKKKGVVQQYFKRTYRRLQIRYRRFKKYLRS